MYADAARAVGEWIGRHGGQLVYGGGRNGLMGVVADATMAAGGRVVGIIPKALVEKEWAHHGCSELHVVDNMHERKRLMAERADAFLALPGGIFWRESDAMVGRAPQPPTGGLSHRGQPHWIGDAGEASGGW